MPAPRKKINESAGERALFFPLATAGWNAYVRATGDAIHFDEWRRLETETLFGAGIRSIKQLNQGEDFDRLMLHFAILAGDDRMMAKFSRSGEQRARWLLDRCLQQIGELEGKPVSWSYVLAICERMHLPAALEDCPAELLMKVYMALDSHRRRMVRRAAA